MDAGDQIEWAKSEVTRLRASLPGFREREELGYYDPSGVTRWSAITPALEFLDRVTPGSTFAEQARERAAKEHSEGAAIECVAAQMENWIRFSEQGLAEAVPYEVLFRFDASTDLMEQVQRLLDDPKVVPAAPVMLAGAALEEVLRSMLAATSETVKGKPSLVTYAEALRSAQVLDATDVKDIISLAAVRNDAAHGQFEKISPERAALMADRVNYFIQQHRPTT